MLPDSELTTLLNAGESERVEFTKFINREATAEEERRLTEKRRWGNLPYDMTGVMGAPVERIWIWECSESFVMIMPGT